MNSEYNKKTNYKDKLIKDYEDSFWRLVMYECAEKEEEELLKEAEETKNDPQYRPSPKAAKRFYRMRDNFFRRKKIISFAKKSQKILKITSMIFVVCTLSFTIAFISVEAFRAQVLNFFWTFEKEYTALKLAEEEPDKDITASLSNTYAPTYITQGYRFDEILNLDNVKIIKYVNEDKNIIFYEYGSANFANIDTENADLIKSIKINGTDGLYVVKNEKSTISWTGDDKIFVISAQINEEELVKIAESVIYIK